MSKSFKKSRNISAFKVETTLKNFYNCRKQIKYLRENINIAIIRN